MAFNAVNARKPHKLLTPSPENVKLNYYPKIVFQIPRLAGVTTCISKYCQQNFFLLEKLVQITKIYFIF